jgi:Ca2+-transporting ATPase
LSQLAGIDRVTANPITGNILVRFSPHFSHATIAAQIDAGVQEYGHLNGKIGGALPRTILQGEERGPMRTRQKLSEPFACRKQHSAESGAQHWHTIDADAAIAQLQTSPERGLSTETVRAALQRDGPNQLPVAAPRSGWSVFLDYFKSVPVALLGAAAGLSLLTGGVVDAAVILGVVVANAILGYTTESRSDKVIRSLQSLTRPSALALRDGRLTEVNAAEIVVGDILALKPGSYVAADARLLETHNLSIDESALTGESVPVRKTSGCLHDWNVPLGDRVNMAYMGTLVASGKGLAVVVATGAATEMGQIQALVGTTIQPETPMERQLDRVGSQLVLVSSAVCGLVFAVGLWRGYGLLQMLKTSISLAVAAVPEGLPTVATTTLALGINEMRKHNVLVRRLDAVETLGSVQTICLDKTGTLTENQMAVVELHADSHRMSASDSKFAIATTGIDPQKGAALTELLRVLALCNECEVLQNANGGYAISGSSTEKALISLALDSGLDVLQLKHDYPLANISHRSEDRNYMKTVHCNGDRQRFVAIKGNPSEVLELCQRYCKKGKVLPLSDKVRQAIELENERMAGQELRVLGTAYALSDSNGDNIDSQHRPIWLGLVGMKDPLRPGVKALIGDFHRAGIDTVMLTGDQSPTAYAIGQELQLSRDDRLDILDSTHLAQIEPEVLKGLCGQVHIFARISPAHKLQIVQSLQAAGKVVAMTGDGINDAPALKAADIGIAMGHTGTDVAREVADIVLEDDELATTITAVSHGRTIYNNIRKSVHFLLATNLSEILVMLFATSAGLGQPLTAMQLLWLNLVTDIFPGLALALEPPEPDVLRSPPRDPNEPIVPGRNFGRIAFESTVLSASALGAYGYGIRRYGIGLQASSIAFMSLVVGQLLHTLSCRSQKRSVFTTHSLPSNPHLKFALGGSLALQLLAAAVPGLRRLLNVAPLNLLDSGTIAGSAILPLLVNELSKNDWQHHNRKVRVDETQLHVHI